MTCCLEDRHKRKEKEKEKKKKALEYFYSTKANIFYPFVPDEKPKILAPLALFSSIFTVSMSMELRVMEEQARSHPFERPRNHCLVLLKSESPHMALDCTNFWNYSPIRFLPLTLLCLLCLSLTWGYLLLAVDFIRSGMHGGGMEEKILKINK